jgi:hypothetical protein
MDYVHPERRRPLGQFSGVDAKSMMYRKHLERRIKKFGSCDGTLNTGDAFTPARKHSCHLAQQHRNETTWFPCTPALKNRRILRVDRWKRPRRPGLPKYIGGQN